MDTYLADAVFEGGGVKGIALIGALDVMENYGYRWRNVAGTSVGSIVASLIAADLSASEIYNILLKKDYDKLINLCKFSHSDFKNYLGIIFENGMYSSDYIKEWIDNILSEKLNIKRSVKFKDLTIENETGILLNNIRYKRKYKLHVIAADITNGRMLILPEDIIDYGIDPDELKVCDAVQMSISLPLFFKPIKLKKPNGTTSLIVDGGVLSNYPVWLFDSQSSPRWPTIGFKLAGAQDENPKNSTNNTLQFVKAIVSTMLEAQDDVHIKSMNYLRTLKIDPLNIRATEFNITPKRALELYNSGRSAAFDFLTNWDINYKKYLSLRQYEIK